MGAVFAIILSFVWITFLAKFAGLLIWSTVYGIELMLPPLGVLCFYKAGMIAAPVISRCALHSHCASGRLRPADTQSDTQPGARAQLV